MNEDEAVRPVGAERFGYEAKILKALAHESRLRIVHRLSEGECCVCELVELIGSDQSTVSRHLARLRAGGIVDGERRGKHIFYRLLTPCVLAFLSCATEVAAEQEANR
jgi:DNA-binding transcriptional ArsR family regulator